MAYMVIVASFDEGIVGIGPWIEGDARQVLKLVRCVGLNVRHGSWTERVSRMRCCIDGETQDWRDLDVFLNEHRKQHSLNSSYEYYMLISQYSPLYIQPQSYETITPRPEGSTILVLTHLHYEGERHRS